MEDMKRLILKDKNGNVIKDFEITDADARDRVSAAEGAIVEHTTAISRLNQSVNSVSGSIDELEQGLQQQIDAMAAELDILKATKFDGFRKTSDGTGAQFTANGEDVGEVLTGIGGSGGGSGSSSSTINAVFTYRNTSGFLTKKVASGLPCPLSVTWSSIEDDMETGLGKLTVSVSGIIKETRDVPQGEVVVDVSEYLTSDTNPVVIMISDTYGQSSRTAFTISVVRLSVSARSFSVDEPFTGAITVPYTPEGSVSKTVHFEVDGSELPPVTTASTGRQLTYEIPEQSHGAHTLRIWATAIVGGEEVVSPALRFEMICLESGNTTPVIQSSFDVAEAMQYSQITFAFRVYNPASFASSVNIYTKIGDDEEKLVSSQTVDRTEQTYTYQANQVGPLSIRLAVDSVSRTFNLNITETVVDAVQETQGLIFSLTSRGRSNNEAGYESWVDSVGGVRGEFTGMNGVSDYWQPDEDGYPAMRLLSGSSVFFDFRPFAIDRRSQGLTIEMDIATHDVRSLDANVVSCVSGGRGLQATAQMLRYASEQSEISMQYREDSHIRLSLVLTKSKEDGIMLIYADGISSACVNYPDQDDFAQIAPAGITFGGTGATVDIYEFNVYDRALTDRQIEDNWIAGTRDGSNMISRYMRNRIFSGDDISLDMLPVDVPAVIFTGEKMPDTQDEVITMSVQLIDQQDPSRNFTADGVKVKPQGTSSLKYPTKNEKPSFKQGFNLPNGTTVSKWAISRNALPVNKFTVKVDYASSEGVNNIGLVDLYEKLCPYKTPAQLEDDRVRQGVEGFAVAIFFRDAATGKLSFYAKGNFNNDKGTAEVYGFAPGDYSYEIKNNNSKYALFQAGGMTPAEYNADFEGRYPDETTYYGKLDALQRWAAKTDRNAATGDALAEPVTFVVGQQDDGSGSLVDVTETYTHDTAEYRLALFRDQAWDWLEKDSTIFYYIFTEFFLLSDSWAKNAFPTWQKDSKCFWLPYDMDTALGINNEGELVYPYSLLTADHIDGDLVYTGQNSVIWNNVRDAFPDLIRDMYVSLCSGDKFTFETLSKTLRSRQVWPEAMVNEDARIKYLQPWRENGVNNLGMWLGLKTSQRDYWLYYRKKYMDSMYRAGSAAADVFEFRAYRKSTITVTTYADTYIWVQFGSHTYHVRAEKDVPYTIDIELESLGDTECYIYNASLIKSITGLEGLNIGRNDFSRATKLEQLVLGSSEEGYQNTRLTTLTAGTLPCLRVVDCTNCANLSNTVDLREAKNLQAVKLGGTSAPGVMLPIGGILETLVLPNTTTFLEVRGHRRLTDYTIPMSNLTTVRIEDTPALLTKSIINQIPAGARVRLVGFEWKADDAAEIERILDILDTFRGLDENGNNMDDAQVSGTIHTDALTGTQIAAYNARYPYLTVAATHTTSYVYAHSGDTAESSVQATLTCIDGVCEAYSGTASKAADIMYTYSFAGWSTLTGATTADANAFADVVADRHVYPAFTATIRQYTASFARNSADGGGTLYSYRLNAGQTPVYSGSMPTTTKGSADDYPFEGWTGLGPIYADTTYYAAFGSPLEEKEITDSWAEIAAAVKDGTYSTKYKVGNYKALATPGGTIRMQIAKKDVDTGCHLRWVAMDALATYRTYGNNSVHTYSRNTTYPFTETDGVWTSTNAGAANTSSKDYWRITPSVSGTLSIHYEVSAEANDKLTIYYEGSNIVSNKGGIVTETVVTRSVAAGQEYFLMATYSKNNDDVADGDDVARVWFTTDSGTLQVEKLSQATYYRYGGTYKWPESGVCSYLNGTWLDGLADEVKTAIVETPITCFETLNNGSTLTATYQSKVFIPSYREVFGGTARENDGPILSAIFTDANSRKRIRVGQSSASGWWLRSSDSTYNIRYVNSNGNSSNSNPNSNNAVVPSFSF